MPVYRVLYLKEQAAVDRFRSQPPPEGAATIKPKDYEQVGEIEATNEYAAWQTLQGEGASERGWRAMGVGDVLEVEGAKPRVCRFVGFDDATWWTFEPRKKTATEEAPAEGEAPG
jgi:hypothetical protein